MNFSLVLKYLLELFNKNKIPHALIGGLALGMHGIVRTTQDVDFIVPLEDLIGLKLQAYLNRKDRKIDDLKDMENIIARFKSKLDYEKLKEYFSVFDSKDLLKKLWEKK